MTAAVLGASWAALVLVAASRRRPAPTRVRELAAAAPAATGCGHVAVPPAAIGYEHVAEPLVDARRGRPGGRGRTEGPPRPGVLTLVGAALLRRWPGFIRQPAPGTARTVGAVTVAAAGALLVAPPMAPLVAVGAVVLSRHRARAAGRRRARRMEEALPDVVDLLVLAVGAGCNVPLAVAAAGRRGTGVLAAELRRVSADVDRGRRVADALDDLPMRAGEPTRALAAVLAGCERYGTPALPALHRLADEVRLQRQRRAEAAARRVPVTLLFPLVLCILPAFALLTVAPLVAGALRELRL